MKLPDILERANSRLQTEWHKIDKHRRRLLLHTGILFAIGVIFILITLSNPWANFQWNLSDRLYPSEELSEEEQSVIVVGIDEETLERMYKDQGNLSAWDRTVHADAINNLKEAGAAVIGFDVLFDAPSDDPAKDEALAKAMEEAGNVVQPVLGIEGQGVNVFGNFLKPNTTLYEASQGIGHANVLPDADGKVRRLPLILEDTEGQSYPSLSLAMLTVLYGEYTVKDGKIHLPSKNILTEDSILRLAERTIPLDSSMGMRVNYVNKPGTLIESDLPYWKVIENDFDHDLVKGKIVVIGITATGFSAEMGGDYWVTPISAEKMYGVEIHATAIDTILRERFLTESSETSTLLIVLLLVFITGLSLPRLNLRWGGLLAGGLFIAYIAIAVFLFYGQGYIMNFVYPPIVLPLIYVTSIIYRITAEQSDKRQVRDLFGKYVSPEVAGEIMRLSDSEGLQLGGEERVVTVLFCDIRGFTQLSEQIPPEGIVNILNRYFSVIIDRILANEGMINKFAGDNIMAVWNAPQSQSDHALLAVRAAVESQQAIREMHEQDADSRQVQFGFGISTGEAIAGNVGSAGRMEYTVIGDAVNLASRICGAATGGRVWISGETRDQLKGEFQLKELEHQQFKGKKEAVAVYEVEQ
ncbi:CHASE2 domain-containing protein [Chloroflexota bacterium]